MAINRFEVYWATLDPTIGGEINKTRPVVVISPNVMNRNLKTVLICPITTAQKLYPTRIPINLNNKKSFVVIDQIRALDKTRLLNKIRTLTQIESDVLIDRIFEVLKK
jgi:mRNA interferase MazF